MHTKLLLSGLALTLACAQGCNGDDTDTSEQFDRLEQRDSDGPAFADAGRVRTMDAGADAGWNDDALDDESSVEGDADDALAPPGPRGGKDGGCRRGRAGSRRGAGERDGWPRPSGDQAGRALDGGIGIFGGRSPR